MDLAAIQAMDRQLLTQMGGQPAVYLGQSAQRPVDTLALVEDAVDPYGDGNLATTQRDLKTVVYLLAVDVPDPKRGDQVRQNGVTIELAEVVKNDGSLITAVVKRAG